ncbi:MAG: GntR family transcriptional regulator, partial [Thermocrispum sp.]
MGRDGLSGDPAAAAIRVSGHRIAAVAEGIEQRVRSGEWRELPTVGDLKVLLRASPTTVSAALRLLAAEGLVVKVVRPGGSYRWVAVGPDGRAPAPESPAQAAAEAREQIVLRLDSGEWTVLPPMAEQARLLGTNQQAVNAALRELAAEGLVRMELVGQHRRWIAVGYVVPPPLDAGRLADRIAGRIASLEWRELPPVNEMAREFHVSGDVAGAALQALAGQGLVAKITRRGRGGHRWVVVDPDSPQRTPVEQVSDDIRARVSGGEWAELPPSGELQRTLRASNETLGAALKALAADGVITKATRGPFGGSPRWVAADPDRPQPASQAEAVAARLRAAIVAGRWPELPTLHELAAEFGTSAVSVGRALRMLRGEGLVTKVMGQPGQNWVLARGELGSAGGWPQRVAELI